ncbi:glycosyltransferase [Pedobacter sp. SD-b]|uniref:Glycosyltransferase n=1 Tax=Pedobacter segetis TaxID=2793069 RepID=A0ABS1BJ97_9SPHI|nr:cellulose synthase family protein [Pedobacter segetis]MBK0382935.1 glycosyltransferase [Pedobacter segetis]
MIWQISILILYTISLIIIFIFSVGQAYLIFSYLRAKKKTDVIPVMPPKIPIVTIQLPLYNELYVVERLINAVCNLNYPSHKLEIQVLDDSDDQSLIQTEGIINKMKTLGYDILHIKREKNIGFKAGALQHGIKSAKGEFIAIFDADFLPEADFLQKLIPYFNATQIGMVQSRWGHINQDYSLLTKIQGFGLDGHFTVEQTGRNKANLFMNFNGTAGIWRKECIIDAGGWQHDTLTEDLDLSYRAQLKGWEFIYVENVVTPAELPVESNALRSQQHRWTKGAIETSKKMIKEIWKADVGLKKKIFGTLHLMNSYVFIFVFITSILSVPVLIIKNNHDINPIYFDMMTFFLLGFVIVTIFYIVATSSKKESIKTFAKLYPMFLSVSMALSFHNSVAVLEGLFGFKSDFIRTPKFNITNLDQNFEQNIYIKRALPKAFFAEFFLVLYFALGLFFAFYYKDFALLPFHLMLFTGFSILTFYSFKHSVVR